MFSLRLALATGSAFLACACGSHDKEKRVTSANEDASFQLVVLGDSVASGMFADTTLGAGLSDGQAKNFAELYQLSQEFPPESEDFYLRAQAVAAAPEYTAFAGSQESSFSTRLASRFGDRIGLRSYAISGATAASLASQTTELAKREAAGWKPATFIVLHVGANDFCAKTPLPEFRAAWSARLREIAATEPQALIMATLVADVPQILTLADQDAVHAGGIDARCSDVRKTLELCAGRADVVPGASAETIAAAQAELAAMNAGIQEELAGIRAADAHPGRFAVASYGFPTLTPDLLAVDCFHPSAAGQKAIAEATWPTAAALLGLP